MKKTLLLAAVAAFTLGANAQKIWNFSNSPFGAVTSYSTTTTVGDLKIMAGSSSAVDMDANSKKNLTASANSFTHRLKMGGSGSPDRVNAPYLPTTRALVFNVSGPGQIKVCCLSSSSSAARKLTITNGTDSLGFFDAPGSYSDTETNTVGLQSFNYTGGAATIYIYSPSSGVNLYYLEATSYSGVPTGLSQSELNENILIGKNEIQNRNRLSLEVYNLTGKKIISSDTNISLKELSKGIYVVKVAGTNQSMKFSI